MAVPVPPGVVGLGALALGLSAMASVAFLTSTEADGTAIADTTQVQTAAASPGRMLFQAKGCSACHALAGISSSRVGPDLTSLPGVAAQRKPGYSAEAYVRESILDPSAFRVVGHSSVTMPDLPITDAEADALVSFLLAP